VKPIAKYYGTLYFEIAEPVPSISEESHSEIASSLALLAMTEKGVPRNDVRASVIAASCCHCERSEAISLAVLSLDGRGLR